MSDALLQVDAAPDSICRQETWGFGMKYVYFGPGLFFLILLASQAGACGGPWDVACNVGKAIEKGVQDAGKTLEKAGQDTGKTVEKAAQDAGKAIEKAAQDTGTALEKAAHDTGRTLEKAGQDIGAELERFTKRVCEDWLNIPDGECFACYTSDRGDGEGAVYACEDGDPNRGQPGHYPSDRDDTPTEQQLDDLQEWVEATKISHEELEPWGDGLERFLPSRTVLGRPLPDDVQVVSPTGSDEVRTRDNFGIGSFLAPRAIPGSDGKKAGTRYHGGVDFVSTPGQDIFSPVNGKVIRITNAYASNNQDLKAIVIGDQGYEYKVLYTKPSVKKDDFVLRGQKIGAAQDLSEKFGTGMTNHVHLSVIDPDGKRVSPNEKWTIKKRR